ncbi:MAG: GAF domain-containing protein [Actinomycetota bacterium]|nr:GAF domain-containing protein [Actinomycetota bacterium]
MTEPVLALRATTSDPLGTAQPGPSVPRDVLAEDPLRAIARILSIARANLPMDVAFVTRLEGDRQTFAYLDGDCESFGWQQGTEMPAKDGYCHHVLAGDLPGVVSDAARHPVAAALPATAQAGIGAYIGVPLVLPNGRVYGALCCTSHDAREDLGPSEHAFVRVLAELVAEQLGRLSEQEARRAATVDTLAPYSSPVASPWRRSRSSGWPTGTSSASRRWRASPAMPAVRRTSSPPRRAPASAWRWRSPPSPRPSRCSSTSPHTCTCRSTRHRTRSSTPGSVARSPVSRGAGSSWSSPSTSR